MKSKFKHGEKVVCVDASDQKVLKLGSLYTVDKTLMLQTVVCLLRSGRGSLSRRVDSNHLNNIISGILFWKIF